MWEKNPTEIIQGKPMQSGSDWKPNLQSAPDVIWTGVWTGVLDVEGEDSYCYTNPTTQRNTKEKINMIRVRQRKCNKCWHIQGNSFCCDEIYSFGYVSHNCFGYWLDLILPLYITTAPVAITFSHRSSIHSQLMTYHQETSWHSDNIPPCATVDTTHQGLFHLVWSTYS